MTKNCSRQEYACHCACSCFVADATDTATPVLVLSAVNLHCIVGKTLGFPDLKTKTGGNLFYPLLGLRRRVGNSCLYVHRNHFGLLGTGKLGGQEFYIKHPLVTLSPPEWFCIKVGSCVSHFNVSLTVWAKSQDSVHKPHFLSRKERRAEADRTKVFQLTSQALYR